MEIQATKTNLTVHGALQGNVVPTDIRPWGVVSWWEDEVTGSQCSDVLFWPGRFVGELLSFTQYLNRWAYMTLGNNSQLPKSHAFDVSCLLFARVHVHLNRVLTKNIMKDWYLWEVFVRKDANSNVFRRLEEHNATYNIYLTRLQDQEADGEAAQLTLAKFNINVAISKDQYQSKIVLLFLSRAF